MKTTFGPDSMLGPRKLPSGRRYASGKNFCSGKTGDNPLFGRTFKGMEVGAVILSVLEDIY